MRKLSSKLIFLALILFMIGSSTLVGFAQTDVDPAPIEEEDQDDIYSDPDLFTFSELGYAESFMVGPYDVVDILFSIPDSWNLITGTYMRLKFSYALGGAGVSRINEANWVGGTILIRFNDEPVQSVLLEDFENQTIDIVFPLETLQTESKDGRHRLRFFLDASVNCDFEDLQTVLMIESDSFIKFVYNIEKPTNDLSFFPNPYYLPDSIVPGKVVISIPDNPSPIELKAGLAISAGLGSITNGESDVEMFQNSELNDELLSANHLIFVGLSKNFQQFQNMDLPIALEDGRFSLPENLSENGVILSVDSPWNPLKSIMLVGGNSDEAVIKAALAVSSGEIVGSGISNLSLVDQIYLAQKLEQSIVDRTLTDLGFQTSTLGTFGEVYYEITFNATSDQSKSEGAYIDLITMRSDLLDLNRSGVMLILNDEVVGTVGFSGTDSSVNREKIEFLPNFVRRGENRLEFISSLVPYDTCYSSDLEASWVTLSENSIIHLPVSDQQIDIGERLDLDNYPQMFFGGQGFSDLAIILPRNNGPAFQYASKLAFFLGNTGNSNIANLDVYYSDEVPDEILTTKNLIFLGTPILLPQLSDIKEYLPATFVEGSNDVIQPQMDVNFSVLSDTSVGYIELLESPWNSDNVVLLALGNSDLGVSFAKNALTDEALINELRGNFAAVFGAQIKSVDTRIISSSVSPMPLPVLEDEPIGEVQVSEPINSQVSNPVSRPAWLIPIIFGFSILMLGLIVFVVVRNSVRSKNGNDQQNRFD